MRDLPKTREYLADWVKKDPDTVEHILTVALSSKTGKPLNLMLRGRSSVGKSWPVSVILHLFPNATIISGATPKNFFYAAGEKLDASGNSIEDRLNEINRELAQLNKPASALRAEDSLRKAELQQERRDLLSNARILLDFTGKIFGVLDSVPQELWDTLKTALSHDSYEQEYRTVVEGRQRIVLMRGWPCIIYATAANEERRFGWEQIRNRFVIITPAQTTEKYESANELTSNLYGLPGIALQALYPKKKLEDAKAEIVQALELITTLRRETGTADDDPTANIVFNPFRLYLNQTFPHLVGDDMRNYRYLHAYINVSALMNAEERPRLVVEGKQVAVVATWPDVERAVGLVGKDLTPVTADKIAFYKKWIIPMWEDRPGDPKPAFTVRDLAEYAQKRGQSLSRRSVKDTFLDVFVDSGLLTEENPERKQNEAIQYRPLTDPDQIDQIVAGFAIAQPPEPEMVNAAISECGGLLAGKQAWWRIDGQTVSFGDLGAYLHLSPHGRIELLQANGAQSITQTRNAQQNMEGQP